MTMRDQFSGWTDVLPENPPTEGRHHSARWLVGRHPRLAHLAARITGVVEVADDGPNSDVDHLAEVLAAEPRYLQAWREYERRHPQPADDRAWERWHAAGPRPDDYAVGLADFRVMSSGEKATLRLLATFGEDRTPFRISDLYSLDAEGGRLLVDWCRAVEAAYGGDPSPRSSRSRRPAVSMPVDSIPYWPVER